MKTGTLGLQPEKVVGGWWHRGCYVVNGGEQQGRLDGIVGRPGVQDERGRSSMMMTWCK